MHLLRPSLWCIACGRKGAEKIEREGGSHGVCLHISATHLQYFESDDPDLYVSKIQYIRENDVTDLELVFAEEEFSDNGTVKVR